jgi:hypothetical protein
MGEARTHRPAMIMNARELPDHRAGLQRSQRSLTSHYLYRYRAQAVLQLGTGGREHHSGGQAMRRAGWPSPRGAKDWRKRGEAVETERATKVSAQPIGRLL